MKQLLVTTAVTATGLSLAAGAIIVATYSPQSDASYALVAQGFTKEAYLALGRVFAQAWADNKDESELVGASLSYFDLFLKGRMEGDVLLGLHGYKDYLMPDGKGVTFVGGDLDAYAKQIGFQRLEHARHLVSIALGCQKLAGMPMEGMSMQLRENIMRLNLALDMPYDGGVPEDLCRRFALEAVRNYYQYNYPAQLALTGYMATGHDDAEAVRAFGVVLEKVLEGGTITPQELEISKRYVLAVGRLRDLKDELFAGDEEHANKWYFATNRFDQIGDVLAWSRDVNLLEQPERAVHK